MEIITYIILPLLTSVCVVMSNNLAAARPVASLRDLLVVVLVAEWPVTSCVDVVVQGMAAQGPVANPIRLML